MTFHWAISHISFRINLLYRGSRWNKAGKMKNISHERESIITSCNITTTKPTKPNATESCPYFIYHTEFKSPSARAEMSTLSWHLDICLFSFSLKSTVSVTNCSRWQAGLMGFSTMWLLLWSYMVTYVFHLIIVHVYIFHHWIPFIAYNIGYLYSKSNNPNQISFIIN